MSSNASRFEFNKNTSNTNKFNQNKFNTNTSNANTSNTNEFNIVLLIDEFFDEFNSHDNFYIVRNFHQNCRLMF